MSKADRRNIAILVVDDDPDMRVILRRCFEGGGYLVIEAESAGQLTELLTPQIDLITLDLKLHNEDGLAIAREIRSRSDVPIIMVTGKDDPIDRIVGLEIGADDYITKPFHIREVLARVRSVLRRTENEPANWKKATRTDPRCFSFGEWVLDLDKYELRSQDGIPSDATSGQLKLLELLIGNRDKTLSRDQIMKLLRGADWMPYDRSIDNRIAGLRRIVEQDPKAPRFIKTVHGIGYRFDGDVETVSDTRAMARSMPS